MAKNRMFKVDGRLVETKRNAVTGCTHQCTYCFAQALAETKLKDVPRYKAGFKPTLNEHELDKGWNMGTTYFICDMGDLWCRSVPDEWIHRVMAWCKKADKSNTMLFLTKSPGRYVSYFKKYPDDYQDNFILGATIESDLLHDGISNAPTPLVRYLQMITLRDMDGGRYRRFLSIEPVMKFDLHTFFKMIRDMRPEFVYIGYDNHNHHLPEQPLREVKMLISFLNSERVCEVRVKTLREAWDVKE